MRKLAILPLLALAMLFSPQTALAASSFSYDNLTTTATFNVDIADCQPGELLEAVLSPDAPPYVWGEVLDFEFYYDGGFWDTYTTVPVNILTDAPIPLSPGTYYATVFCYPESGDPEYYQHPVLTEQFTYTAL